MKWPLVEQRNLLRCEPSSLVKFFGGDEKLKPKISGLNGIYERKDKRDTVFEVADFATFASCVHVESRYQPEQSVNTYLKVGLKVLQLDKNGTLK